MNITGRGLCIVISDVNPNDFIGVVGGNLYYDTGVFSDIKTIADCIRNGMKIAAIKEVRSQTGWGLKEAKEYIDRYTNDTGFGNITYNPVPRGTDERVNIKCADRFIKDHTPAPPTDLLDEDEFKV